MTNRRLLLVSLVFLSVIGSHGNSRAQSSASTRINSSSVTLPSAPIRIQRLGSTLLVDVSHAAKELGWEAKVVTPGKLLTLCRGGDDGICIPIQLDKVIFREERDGLYVEAAAVARALRIRFHDQGGQSITIGPAEALAITNDEIPAYNADWGAGRGFRVGQTLPDIPLIDLAGREVRFSQFLGKQYIIYCWSSW